jgi:hypothetical protein
MKPTPKPRGRGQPKKEATRLIRAYSDDVPRLAKYGKTQAEAVRALLTRSRP